MYCKWLNDEKDKRLKCWQNWWKEAHDDVTEAT